MTVEKHDLFLSLEKPNLTPKIIQVWYFSSGFQILTQGKEVKILTLYTLLLTFYACGRRVGAKTCSFHQSLEQSRTINSLLWFTRGMEGSEAAGSLSCKT